MVLLLKEASCLCEDPHAFQNEWECSYFHHMKEDHRWICQDYECVVYTLLDGEVNVNEVQQSTVVMVAWRSRGTLTMKE